MAYLYPPIFENGRLKSSLDPVQIVQSKIFQLLSVYKEELIGDPLYGINFKLFKSVSNIQADASQLEVDLLERIPEANFSVEADIQDGSVLVTINWELLGRSQTPIIVNIEPQ